MSKRDEDAASDMEDGMTTSERQRRRRRGAGLRIPSDNVPRRPTGPETAAPVAESSLAVSPGSYALADEPAVTQRIRVDELPDIGEIEDATAIVRPLLAVKVGTGRLEMHARENGEAGDLHASGRTQPMSAASFEALGLNDDSGADEPARPRVSGIADVVANDVVPSDGDPPKRRISGIGDAVEIDVENDDSVESVVDPVLLGGGRRVPSTTAPPIPIRSGRESLPPPVEPGSPAVEAARAESSREVPPVAATRHSRTHTVALSEDDLEELLEATPPPRAAPRPTGGAPVGAVGAGDEVVASATAAVAPVEGDGKAAVDADGGEILADEIVEEHSGGVSAEMNSANPPGAGARPPAPPPAAPVAKRTPSRATPAVSAETDVRKKRRGKPWFEEIFDEDYLRTLPFLTPQATQAEALMVIESLGAQAPASVLDLGCGYGRHAMELAARGFHVVGVDLSLPLLLRGAEEAQRRGLDISFMHADMREIDFDAQFDGAYCLFSTFGYFDDETNKRVATAAAKALKPGARIVLEVLNRDYVIGDLPTRVWWEGDGCVVLEEVEFNYFSSRVQSKRSIVFDDGRQVEQEISVRVYSLHEIGKLLHASGFRVLEVSGSIVTRGRFLGSRSREIIVVAERRPGADHGKSNA